MTTQFQTYRAFLNQQYVTMCVNQELSYSLHKAIKLFTLAQSNVDILKNNAEYDRHLSELIDNISNFSELEIENLTQIVQEYIKGIEIKNVLLKPKIKDIQEKLDYESCVALINKGMFLIEQINKPLNFKEASLLEVEIKNYLLLFPHIKETNVFFEEHNGCSSQLRSEFNSLSDQIVENSLGDNETNYILKQNKLLLEGAKDDINGREIIVLSFKNMNRLIEKHPRFLKIYEKNIEKLKVEIGAIKIFTTHVAEEIAHEIKNYEKEFQEIKKRRLGDNLSITLFLIIGGIVIYFFYMLIQFIIHGDVFGIIGLIGLLVFGLIGLLVIGWIVYKIYDFFFN